MTPELHWRLRKGIPTPWCDPVYQWLLWRLSGMKKSPFGQTAVRFKLNKQAIQTPGNLLYTITLSLLTINRSRYVQWHVSNQSSSTIIKEGNVRAILLYVLHVVLPCCRLESGKRGGFGSVSSRSVPLVGKDTAELPGRATHSILSANIILSMTGPAHYNPTSDCKSVVSWVPESCTANFASKTKRLHEPPPIVTVRCSSAPHQIFE